MRNYLVLAFWALASAAFAGFTPEERQSVMDFWSQPGRYQVALPPTASRNGPFQVRLTPEASLWFHGLMRAKRGEGKLPNGVATQFTPSEVAEIDRWVKAKLAWDRAYAADVARRSNAMFGISGPPPVPVEPPGPIPERLALVVGNAPRFAGVVTPMQYRVEFADQDAYTYVDQTSLSPQNAYFRSPSGVMSAGEAVSKMPAGAFAEVAKLAGLTDSEIRIVGAVSALEGGFDAVNTYDTGGVSIGFIQFACLSGGSGSLGAMMLRMRRELPQEFEDVFRRYGVDVDEGGTLTVVDPVTGAEVFGAAAVAKIIDDKRLTATFQRAGRWSRGFRMMQVKTAKEMYYPLGDSISVIANNELMIGRVSDVIKSEAGLATLMDRKVQTGKLGDLINVLQRVAIARGARTLAQLAKHEREIVAAMKHRRDFLIDPTLSQPQ